MLTYLSGRKVHLKRLEAYKAHAFERFSHGKRSSV
jgi:hypothetical protein